MNKILRSAIIALPLLLFFMLVIFFWLGLHKDPRALPSVLIGKPMPTFQADTLNHQHKLSDKQFKGHVTVLNVWASWCYPCRVEHNILLRIKRNKTAKNNYHLQLIGLNYKDQAADAKQMLSTFGNPYDDVIYDPQGLLAMNFGVYGTPETFIIDANGVIRYRYTGAITSERWRDEILPMIKNLAGNANENV